MKTTTRQLKNAGARLKVGRLRKRAARLKPFSSRTKQAQKELRLFFSQSLDMMCIAGFDGYFKSLNPAWKSTLGWTLEELRATPFLDFVHPDDRQATLGEIVVLASGAATISFENRYRCKDGSYRWLQWNAKSRPARGQIYAMAATSRSRSGWKGRFSISVTGRKSAWGGNCMTGSAKIWPASPL